MNHTTFVTFRGVEDVAINWGYADDPPTNSLDIEWAFDDIEMKNVGETLTQEEYDAIEFHIVKIINDPHFEDDDFRD